MVRSVHLILQQAVVSQAVGRHAARNLTI